MFILHSEYKKLQKELLETRKDLCTKQTNYIESMIEYKKLREKYIDLLSFCEKMSLQSTSSQSQFTSDEIKMMLTLCHPDKHGGNPKASAITAKLLELWK